MWATSWSITALQGYTNTWHLHSTLLPNHQALNIITLRIFPRPDSKEGDKETHLNRTYDSKLTSRYLSTQPIFKHILFLFFNMYCVQQKQKIKTTMGLVNFFFFWTFNTSKVFQFDIKGISPQVSVEKKKWEHQLKRITQETHAISRPGVTAQQRHWALL